MIMLDTTIYGLYISRWYSGISWGSHRRLYHPLTASTPFCSKSVTKLYSEEIPTGWTQGQYDGTPYYILETEPTVCFQYFLPLANTDTKPLFDDDDQYFRYKSERS